MLNSNNYLYLIWKDPNTRRNFIVGKLTRSEKYTFEYCAEAQEAEKHGWGKMKAFSEQQVYESDNMFPIFASRLPDKKRRDIDQILSKYNLDYFDEFELLRRSGAKLPIDTYEFIDPIVPNEIPVEREFYVMGIRHYATCNGTDCSLLRDVKAGDFLVLQEEPDNEYDSMAIRVLTQTGVHLGYIPRYYNQAILDRLHKKVSYSCKVLEIHDSANCSECLKVKLNMPSTFDN